ncbi:hypothetical protein BB934_35625 (plasmid) [Microvirga ossetica]|uniref:Uncharacterized protein n=1 Tax=Microvirga ossetica TaxID=1882682 RepID=A0A1B2EUE4_9HYPH|nr:hypothetical protein [Microvirga ossetica]ANY83588.1 hypothetical protein BB934_35625 [Microvirga ossetica]
MVKERTLLKQAVDELATLEPRGDDPTHYQAERYTSALAEWSKRLAISTLELNQLVLIRKLFGVGTDPSLPSFEPFHTGGYAKWRGLSKMVK